MLGWLGGLWIVLGLAGGLALFLLGLERLATGLKALAGAGLKQVLERLTANRWAAAAVGAGVTAVIQSSSVTTVLVVSLVSAGLLNSVRATGVIIGANVGTTVTAQIVAFDLAGLALPLTGLGFVLGAVLRDGRAAHVATAVLGLGLVFVGMAAMADALVPLREDPAFAARLAGLTHPLAAVLAGAAFTAVIQSSSATLAIVIVLAGGGLVTLETGILLALGANVGTCVTAVLATLEGTRESRRAALVHVLFNLLGVALWLPFLGLLAAIAVWLSPAHPELAGAARIAADAPRQIAMANTAFNLLNALLFLPLAGTLAGLARRLVPDRAVDDETWSRPLFLDPTLRATPVVALEAARRELGRLAARVTRMLELCGEARETRSSRLLRGIPVDEARVDELHAAILQYLSGLSRETLDAAQAERVQDLVRASAALELASNMIESRLEPVVRKILIASEAISPTTAARLDHLSGLVRAAYRDMEVAVAFADGERSRAVEAVAPEIERLADEVVGGVSRHLAGRDERHVTLLRAEMELTVLQVTLYTFARQAASLAARAGASPGSG